MLNKMKRNGWSALVALLCLAGVCGVRAEPGGQPSGPVIIGTQPSNEGSLLRLADGTLLLFYTDMEQSQVLTIRSTDHGVTWGEPRVEFTTGKTHHGIYAFAGKDGQTHVLYLDKHGKGKVNVDYTIDVLHRVSSGEMTGWSEPTIAFSGYTGALRGAITLDTGRLLVPIGAWNHPSDTIEPDTGNNTIAFVYSDDDGQTWTRTSHRISSPIYPDYNGANYGAVEPSIRELGDGRLWLMFRTQTGFMYEAFSSDPDGMQWGEAKPSRFKASNSPCELIRLQDGRLVIFWNNSTMPPRFEGQGVYGGREALHAAISDDHGKTWRGFREVFRDPSRHASPPQRGDRGTAYATAVQAADGMVMLTTGQGVAARRMIRFDPDWLTQTQAQDDFTDGVEQWHVFTSFGPAARWWRDRGQGAQVVEDATASNGKALLLSRPEDRVGDGAVWNFPLAASGQLTLRIQVSEGFGGGAVTLTDYLANPDDDTAPDRAVFTMSLDEVPGLKPGQWQTLSIRWDADARMVSTELDGSAIDTVPMKNPSANGVCYVMLRNTALQADPKGWRVDSVQAQVTDPYTR